MGGVTGVPPAREEDMLAGGTPVTPLDNTRLGEFPAEPGNSHGASSAQDPAYRAR
jgi:hypothetical protein